MAKEKELSDFNNRTLQFMGYMFTKCQIFKLKKKKFGVLVLQFFLNVPFNSLIELILTFCTIYSFKLYMQWFLVYSQRVVQLSSNQFPEYFHHPERKHASVSSHCPPSCPDHRQALIYFLQLYLCLLWTSANLFSVYGT